MYALTIFIAVALAPLVAQAHGLWPGPAAGKEVKPHSRPYHVHIYVVDPRKYVGSGAMLTEQWVLTSASFIEGAKNTTAIIGAHTAQDLENRTLFHEINNVVIHPEYEPVTGTNDVALMRMLLYCYPDGTFAQTIRLPSKAHRLESFLRFPAETTGFGLDANNSPSVLRSVELQVVENSMCSTLYGSQKIVDTHMCVYGSETGPFGGYIGGPLVIIEKDGRPTVIGVHSRSTSDLSKPAVYTRLTNYLTWISKTAFGGVTIRD